MNVAAAARVGLLSRHPAGITAVRAARTELDLEVEFVWLEKWRAVVVAAFSPLTLQSRQLTPAERRLVADDDHPAAATEHSYALRVRSIPGELLALSTSVPVREGQEQALAAIGHALEAQLRVQPRPKDASSGPNPEAILANQRDAVVVLDADFVIRYCNNAIITMFGWTPDELVGRVATEIVHPEDLLVAVESIERLQQANEIYRVRLRLLDASGEWRQVSTTAIDQRDNPDVGGVIVSLRRSEYESESSRTLAGLEDRARNDQLTGLSNRRSLSDALVAHTSMWTHAEDARGAVAALSIDLDNFKAVNDVHGHRIGDEVLRIVADRLGSFTMDGDLLARIGGDEFVLIFADADRAYRAAIIAQHVRQWLAMPYEIDGNRLHLTASIGVASQDRSSVAAETLLQDADIALFAAKERGRDQLVVFDTELAVAGILAQSQRNMVRDALSANRLRMHYQPIVDLNGKIHGVEALARCVDGDGELCLPGDFLKSIAGTSLLVRLDRQAFEQSCQLAAALENRWPGKDLFVSCNFSANTLAQSDFAETVLAAMARFEVAGSSICIEITESAAFEAGPLSIDALSNLHAAGLRIALDDFGTGYSSLAHLRDLPLSSVKIDRSFIKELHTPGPEQTIGRAIAELAHSLGFSIVAEGIETIEQLDAACSIGIDRMQGWYFDQALSPEMLNRRLEAQFDEEADAPTGWV